jgi:hypothetical protein
MTKQTIAQLHHLDQNDPWDRRTEAQKALDIFRHVLRDSVHDPVVDTRPFVDPPDDESLEIRDAPGRRFHRLAVCDLKLAALLTLEPSLVSIGVTARNTAEGCWVALTSFRVGSQVADRLRAQGLAVTLVAVSSDGQPMATMLSDEQRDAVYRGLIESTQNN